MLLLWPLISLASVVAADSHAAQHENRLGKRGSTLIPSSCFANDEALYSYFEVGYPWGDHQHHNGAATMLKSQISTAGGYLSLRSTYIGGTGKYTYNSGTVYAKQQFTVPPGGGLDFEASFQAPTQKVCPRVARKMLSLTMRRVAGQHFGSAEPQDGLQRLILQNGRVSLDQR